MSNITIVQAGILVAAHDQPALSQGAAAVSGERIEAVGLYSELSKRYPHAKTIGKGVSCLFPV